MAPTANPARLPVGSFISHRRVICILTGREPPLSVPVPCSPLPSPPLLPLQGEPPAHGCLEWCPKALHRGAHHCVSKRLLLKQSKLPLGASKTFPSCSCREEGLLMNDTEPYRLGVLIKIRPGGGKGKPRPGAPSEPFQSRTYSRSEHSSPSSGSDLAWAKTP